MLDELLTIKGLKVYFYTRDGVIPAVDDVSFHIKKGETLGLVGESGCGKSVTSLSILQLLPQPPGRIESGEILFCGEDLLKKNKKEIKGIRGNRISMIFQEVMNSLNPVLTIGRQLTEVIEVHQELNREQATKKAVEILNIVGIPRPKNVMTTYPHQLSGGMRQRVMIAMALLCKPELLIADEPTTALDVTIQAQVIELMKGIKEMLGTSILFISHDLALVSEMAERIIVMYAGNIIEEAETTELFSTPMHPYTKGLLSSIPTLTGERGKLNIIKGSVPRPTDFPDGCRFHPRCEMQIKCCLDKTPPLVKIGKNRMVRCWLYS
ncbi:MAG: ABC transporter ATP-binding protein [Calditrichaeota bacterium]|nr:ABC transporter ATP-binding protein [Deltaproteobacteria bacterium]MBT7619415.1 ABC transporter ATP-binding protein [Calditrichota bacterium]